MPQLCELAKFANSLSARSFPKVADLAATRLFILLRNHVGGMGPGRDGLKGFHNSFLVLKKTPTTYTACTGNPYILIRHCYHPPATGVYFTHVQEGVVCICL